MSVFCDPSISVTSQEAVRKFQSSRRTNQDKFRMRGGRGPGKKFDTEEFISAIINPAYPLMLMLHMLPVWTPRPDSLRKSIFHGIKPSQLEGATTFGGPRGAELSRRESRQVCRALKRGGVLREDRTLQNVANLEAALTGLQVGLFHKKSLSGGQQTHVELIVNAFDQRTKERRRVAEDSWAAVQALHAHHRGGDPGQAGGCGDGSGAAYSAATMSAITSAAITSYF